MPTWDYYNTLFDSIRGEVHSKDYLVYQLLNETVKKVIKDNNEDLLKFWEDVSFDQDPAKRLSSLLSYYGQENIGELLKTSIVFSQETAKKLADFSIKNRQEPLLDVKEFLDMYERFLSTQGGKYSLGIPNIIFNLMQQLAGVQHVSTFYDGSLLQVNNFINAHLHNSKAKIYVETPHQREEILAEMLSFLYLENQAHIEQGDALLEPNFTLNNYELMKFDSIVMAPPMGRQVSEDYTKIDRYGRFTNISTSHRDSSFGYIAHTIACMNEKGKACIMVSTAPLFRSGREEKTRRDLLESNLIEGIIQLPSFILMSSGISPCLVVLNKNKSQNDKGRIKFLNATDIFIQEGRRKVLNQENIDHILEVFFELKEDKNVFRKVNITEVIENDANLLPEKYFFQESIDIPGLGKVEAEDVLKSTQMISMEELADVFNGVNIRPAENGEKTIKVIKASDIQDGELLLESIEHQAVDWKRTYERGIVHSGDLVMLSKGTNIKMAVVPEIDEGFVASTNLMIIRPKENVDPHFLQFYLESPFGQLELERIKSGGVIATWPLKEFKKIKIPLFDKEMQVKAAKNYRDSKENYLEALKRAKEDKELTQLKIYQELGFIN